MTMTLTSTAFDNGSDIPALYTCDGQDCSPPLDWRHVPEGAVSLALIVDDPDAPDPAAPKMTWVHWVLYNIPVRTTRLTEGIAPDALPQGCLQGINDWHRPGYGGPCPPVGRHRYFFKLYALDCLLPDLKSPPKVKLEAAMDGHILETAELIGLFQR